MKQKNFLLLVFSLVSVISRGQSMTTDSCGTDTSALLKKVEIRYLDSVFFAPHEIRNGESFSFTDGFDFNEKRIAFFDCGKTTENGYMTKKEFFLKVLPEYRGPHGLTILNDTERKETGYDAIIVINCKMIAEGELVEKLKSASK